LPLIVTVATFVAVINRVLEVTHEEWIAQEGFPFPSVDREEVERLATAGGKVAFRGSNRRREAGNQPSRPRRMADPVIREEAKASQTRTNERTHLGRRSDWKRFRPMKVRADNSLLHRVAVDDRKVRRGRMTIEKLAEAARVVRRQVQRDLDWMRETLDAPLVLHATPQFGGGGEWAYDREWDCAVAVLKLSGSGEHAPKNPRRLRRAARVFPSRGWRPPMLLGASPT